VYYSSHTSWDWNKWEERYCRIQCMGDRHGVVDAICG